MACGDTVNPYSVSWTSPTTVSEFSTDHYRVELRRAIRLNQVWFWIRVTVKAGSNYLMGETAKLVSPCKIVTGLPYGSGSNWNVGSQRCSAAVSVGQPASITTITYAGAAYGSHGSRTVRA